MAARPRSSHPVPVSDLASAIIDPVLRKRAGVSIGLVQSWEKIVWPRRLHEEDPFEPATLVIACEGAAALHLQHETGEIIGRVNAFLGFAAIGRIKIVQKPVRHNRGPEPARLRELDREEVSRIARSVGGIEDEGLRASLERLGRSVLGSRK